jgi:hypothetical protein
MHARVGSHPSVAVGAEQRWNVFDETGGSVACFAPGHATCVSAGGVTAAYAGEPTLTPSELQLPFVGGFFVKTLQLLLMPTSRTKFPEHDPCRDTVPHVHVHVAGGEDAGASIHAPAVSDPDGHAASPSVAATTSDHPAGGLTAQMRSLPHDGGGVDGASKDPPSCTASRGGTMSASICGSSRVTNESPTTRSPAPVMELHPNQPNVPRARNDAN